MEIAARRERYAPKRRIPLAHPCGVGGDVADVFDRLGHTPLGPAHAYGQRLDTQAIDADDSELAVWVVHVDEASVAARDVARVLAAATR